MVIIDWKTYEPRVEIQRTPVLQDLEQWADSDDPKRVCSIIAAPGTGKTWLMQAARRKWNGGDDANPTPAERLVIWVDVPRLVNLGTDGEPVLSNDNVFDWLSRERDHALSSKFCSKLKKVNPRADSPVPYIDYFATEICENSKRKRTTAVLVDGYDEIPEDWNEDVDSLLVERFFSKECFRLIIGRRSDRRLASDVLHRNQKIMDLGVFNQPAKQFELFRQTWYPAATHLTPANFAQWQKFFPVYKWDHPFINAFLFNRALASGMYGPLTPADLRACCDDLIQRPDASQLARHPLERKSFELLVRMANEIRDSKGKPQDEWTSETFEEALKVQFRDKQLTPLFDYGVLAPVKGTLLYRIMDGLRDLLRELYLLENPGT